MTSRFVVLDDDRKLLLGIDKAGVFESGMVYEAQEIIGEVIIRKVGKYALPKQGPSYPNELSEANVIISAGVHLLTERELQQIRET